MADPRKQYFTKRANILVKNLKNRHFDAWFCQTREEALEKALSLIPEGASVAWGGAMSAQQIGLTDAIRQRGFQIFAPCVDSTPEEKAEIYHQALLSDVYITGANALSLDGEMVSIDGTGNRVAAMVYGPKSVIVIAGMNKVEDTLEAAMNRARTVAAPMNKQRFHVNNTPCAVNGTCGDCTSEGCICNQILVTRHCRPVGRIKFILVGEDLGL